MCKNNSRNSSKFKGCSPRLNDSVGQALQPSFSLIVMKLVIGYYSYTNRWVTKFNYNNRLVQMNDIK